MVNFAELKKSKNKQLESLNKKLSDLQGGTKNFKDDRIWAPTVDKAGNGYAVIRFLPAPSGEDFPFVRIWDHGFKGPSGKWYIEPSLTSINQPDPVAELNSKLWNSGDEGQKKAREQKRRLSYYSNILVISDPSAPENEGQVFLYKYGKKIFDKLQEAMNPEFEDEEAMNPFDMWDGADFKIKIRQVEGWRNYDKSEFSDSSVITLNGEEQSDEELEKIWNSQHSLQELLDPKNFKSYDELKIKLYRVLDDTMPVETADTEDENQEMSFKPKFKEQVASRGEEKQMSELDESDPPFDLDDATSDSEDDGIAFFEEIANMKD